MTPEALWSSAAHGRHAVALRRAVDGPALGSVDIDVVAGAVAVLAGSSPTTTRP